MHIVSVTHYVHMHFFAKQKRTAAWLTACVVARNLVVIYTCVSEITYVMVVIGKLLLVNNVLVTFPVVLMGKQPEM